MKLGELVYGLGVAEGCTKVLIWAKEGIKLNLELVLIKVLRRILSVFKISCHL